MNVSDKLLQLARRCRGLKVFDLGFSVSADVHVELRLLTFRVDHPSPRGQQEGAEPQGINLEQRARPSAAAPSAHAAAAHTPEAYADVLVKPRDGGLQVLDGDQHVLDHVMLLIKLSDGFSLSELQQRDLRGDHPSEQPAKQRVVSEGNDILEKQLGSRCGGHSLSAYPGHLKPKSMRGSGFKKNPWKGMLTLELWNC